MKWLQRWFASHHSVCPACAQPASTPHQQQPAHHHLRQQQLGPAVRKATLKATRWGRHTTRVAPLPAPSPMHAAEQVWCRKRAMTHGLQRRWGTPCTLHPATHAPAGQLDCALCKAPITAAHFRHWWAEPPALWPYTLLHAGTPLQQCSTHACHKQFRMGRASQSQKPSLLNC